jgi:hypothetical protein
MRGFIGLDLVAERDSLAQRNGTPGLFDVNSGCGGDLFDGERHGVGGVVSRGAVDPVAHGTCPGYRLRTSEGLGFAILSVPGGLIQ